MIQLCPIRLRMEKEDKHKQKTGCIVDHQSVSYPSACNEGKFYFSHVSRFGKEGTSAIQASSFWVQISESAQIIWTRERVTLYTTSTTGKTQTWHPVLPCI